MSDDENVKKDKSTKSNNNDSEPITEETSVEKEEIKTEEEKVEATVEETTAEPEVETPVEEEPKVEETPVEEPPIVEAASVEEPVSTPEPQVQNTTNVVQPDQVVNNNNYENNNNYANTNNMYSAYLGIRSMFKEGFEPFLMMNADVFFFYASIITSLEKDTRGNLVVVDIGRYIEESMKVVEKHNRLVQISKQISPNKSLGCSIDVYKFGADGGRAFYEQCIKYIERKKELKEWSEVALNDTFTHAVFQVCPLNGRWLEIDTYEDLVLAEDLFAK